MESLQTLLGQRVRDARKRLGLTQQELAATAGFGVPQIISQIENGERDIKAWELVRLAKALAVNVQDLLSQEQAAEPVVLWRELPQEHGGVKEARFLQRYRQFRFVERMTGAEPSLRPPRSPRTLRQMSYHDTAALADAVRRDLELADRPAYALLEAAEQRYGIQIWYADLEHDGSAASYVDADGSAAVLLSLVEPPWRRSFSFAHELFHIVTWDQVLIEQAKNDQRLFDWNEKLANAFASALLLPEEAVRSAVRQALASGGMTYAALVAMAREFEVSTSALLWRLRNMGIYRREMVERVLADPTFTTMDAESRRGKWWTPPPLPSRFVRLAYLAWQQGHLSRAKLAEYLDANLATLDDELGQYGLSESQVDEEVDFTVNAADCFALEDEEWPVLVPSA
jgi:Zn-dependent peptidase ImmA (M78 family)/transcriptional regulator with XRE-family HTH domain